MKAEHLPNAGFLVIDKPGGFTSQQVVAILKRLFRWKKAGHTGTLDPLATGVLPVAWGEATKAIPFLDESRKVYEVTGRLGAVSTTYDAEGEISGKNDFANVDQPTLQHCLEKFHGEVSQTPPPFSAVKIQGKPAYRLARKGELVSLAPRRVFFESIEILECAAPQFRLRVSCSRGTYIRSLVHDVGQELNCGAYVVELRRLATGPFRLENSVGLTLLQNDFSVWQRGLLSIEECLSNMPQMALVEDDFDLVKSGNVPHRLLPFMDSLLGTAANAALTQGGEIVAFIARHPALGFKLERVLHRD